MSRTLTKKLVSVKPGTIYVGVDMGQDNNVAVVLGERAEQLGSACLLAEKWALSGGSSHRFSTTAVIHPPSRP